MIGATSSPVTASWACTTPLLPHQRPAVAKLLPAKVGGLFLEMGAGKTRTGIELVRLRQAKISRCVWFCPVGLKETVRREILKHTDCTEADIYVFDEQTDETTCPRDRRWYICGIESISARSARVVCTARALIDERAFVIVDESGYIKGPRSRRTERLTLIAAPARYRLILTGTPISQGIVDLFAQMRFLSPRILGYRAFSTFARHHLVYSKKFPGLIEGETGRDYIAGRIRPYVYQVTKAECMDLPPKLFAERYCTLTPEQRRAYGEAKDRILVDDYLLGDDWARSCAVFQLFTVLQCIVCGFETLPDGTIQRYPHARIDLLKTTLAQAEGAPVVIWAKYREALEQICAALAPNYPVFPFHGGLSPANRQANLDTWRRSGGVLVATQAAGGHGLDMTTARFVIFYANSFKYSERLQAEDRCHRIGQDRPVTYVDLWAGAGIENRVSRALSRKEDAVRSFRQEVEKVRATNKLRLLELAKTL